MRLAILCLVACQRSEPPPAPTPPEVTPAAIGETFHLDSKILGERRTINVYVPPDYARSGERFAVLYMPDGGMAEDFPHVTGIVDVSIKDAVIRPLIVVGIENTERRHDLVGPSSVEEDRKAAPHAGGADNFRKFLRDELRPWVAAHYRVTEETAIIGESLAGLFVLETLFVEPSLFDTYIAVDPSVWWNDGALVKSAAARFAAWHERPKRLVVATADYKPTQDGIALVATAIHDDAPAGLQLTLVPLPEEHHNTIYPFAALRGLRTMFARAADP